MKYLLDTHTIYWFLEGDMQISEKASSIIKNEYKDCCVSLASVWETAIKISIGKLDFVGGVKEFVRLVKDSGIAILPIQEEHILQIERLPLHHKDPFDRVIITTAIEDDLTIVSKDENFSLYPVKCIW